MPRCLRSCGSLRSGDALHCTGQGVSGLSTSDAGWLLAMQHCLVHPSQGPRGANQRQGQGTPARRGRRRNRRRRRRTQEPSEGKQRKKRRKRAHQRYAVNLREPQGEAQVRLYGMGLDGARLREGSAGAGGEQRAPLQKAREGPGLCWRPLCLSSAGIAPVVGP